jgi:ATP-dependent Clp protease ATP-binding subunit ClpC
MEHAIEEAKALGNKYVGTEHILLSLLRRNEGTTAKVLTGLVLKYEDVRREIINILGMDADEGKGM